MIKVSGAMTINSLQLYKHIEERAEISIHRPSSVTRDELDDPQDLCPQRLWLKRLTCLLLFSPMCVTSTIDTVVHASKYLYGSGMAISMEG